MESGGNGVPTPGRLSQIGVALRTSSIVKDGRGGNVYWVSTEVVERLKPDLENRRNKAK
jgi:hypothetical protein